MENYNEKVNYGTDKEPFLKDRLKILNVKYGHTLYDRKLKKALISYKSLESCRAGKDLLLKDKHDEFEKFLKEIEGEVVVENKIIMFNGKHIDTYYYANSYEQLKKVALNVLKERLDYWYITKWSVPDELDYTYDDIDKLPETFRKDAKEKLLSNKKRIKDAVDNNNMYEAAVRAINEGNGDLAWSIIQNRAEYEYETFEFIEPHNL